MTKRTLGPTPFIDAEAEVSRSTLGAWTEVGPRTKVIETVMGDYSYVVNDSDIIYTDIGKFCSIAANVRINPGNHPVERAAMHHFTYRSALFDLGEDDDSFFDWRRDHKVTLGDDVWVGHGAIVMPGVTIGTGAVIGSGAVVTKDVDPFTIIVGVPGRPLRKRFRQEIIEGLMRIRWWDWDHALLKERLPDFRAMIAESFVEKYDR